MTPITLAEAGIVIENMMKRVETNPNLKLPYRHFFNATRDYCKRFSNFHSNVRALLLAMLPLLVKRRN